MKNSRTKNKQTKCVQSSLGDAVGVPATGLNGRAEFRVWSLGFRAEDLQDLRGLFKGSVKGSS